MYFPFKNSDFLNVSLALKQEKSSNHSKHCIKLAGLVLIWGHKTYHLKFHLVMKYDYINFYHKTAFQYCF